MKKVTEKYYCDVCHKKVKLLRMVQIPIDCDDGITLIDEVNICSECFYGLKKVIKDNFADMELVESYDDLNLIVKKIKYKEVK